ncbi:MAG TPA: flagellar protein FlaG [Symbiobacteriaceae bacterium]|nr:flagellar protein FlaG [Symbiobacteriaceae bacterium]
MRLAPITNDPAAIVSQRTSRSGEVRPAEARVAAEPDALSLEKAVGRMNDMIKHTDNNMLEFQMDDHNRTIIKVIDRNTHEVVEQFPAERLLKVLQSMDDLLGKLLDEKA